MTTTTTSAIDLGDAVESIRPVIEAHIAEGEAQRQLAPAVYEALRDSGLLRTWIPRACGGHEAHPVEAFRTFQALAGIDPAVGWNLNQHAAVSSMAAMLHDGLDEVFADPDAIFAGVFWPPGAATEVDGGFRVSATLRFASGCHYAQWMFVPAIVHVDGEPQFDPESGAPDFLATFLYMNECTVRDTWRTMGMRATGSNDVVVDEVFVPEHRAARVFGLPAQRPAPVAGPLYGLFPWPGAQAHASVPVGIARAAVDRLVALAQTKVPNFSEVTLRNRELAQAQAAQARATVDAASAYLDATATAAYDTLAAGRSLTQDHKLALQLSATNCASAAIAATNLVQQAAGSSAMFEDAGFEKLFRDANTVVQHAVIQTNRYQSAGQVMFGLPTDWFAFHL